MLWGSQMKTLTISKERRRGTRYTPILLKTKLNGRTNCPFAVNQYKYPSLDVRPLFQTKLPIWRSHDTYFGLCGTH